MTLFKLGRGRMGIKGKSNAMDAEKETRTKQNAGDS